MTLRFANRNTELKQHLVEQIRERTAALEQVIALVLDQEGLEGPAAHDVTVAAMALTQGLVRRRRIEGSAVSDEFFVRALGWLFEGVCHG
jgi:inosine-uridine nucleoside N-ribohydrolase